MFRELSEEAGKVEAVGEFMEDLALEFKSVAENPDVRIEAMLRRLAKAALARVGGTEMHARFKSKYPQLFAEHLG